jgi:hypothetical protein
MMPRRIAAALCAVACLGFAAPAVAACTPPAAPDASAKPAKPALPAKGPCVDAKPGTTGCLGWEGYTYNDEIRAYNEKAQAFGKAAQAYVDRLNAYVKASADYAQCEVKTLQ